MAEIKDLVRAVDSLTDEDRTHFLQMMALRYKNERQEKWDKLVYAACEALNNLLEVFSDVGIYDTDGYICHIKPMMPEDFVTPEEEDLNDLI